MTDTTTLLPDNIHRTKIAILIAYYALLVYFLFNAVLVFGELRLASIVIWLIQTVPLLIFAIGYQISFERH